MPDVTEHYGLDLAGAAGVQNKWALYDGNFAAIERGRTMKRQAGEALSIRQVVYIDPTTGKFLLATNADRPLVGLMIEDAALNAETYAQTEGPVTDDQATPSWNWTPGGLIYAHLTTPGALTQTHDPTQFHPPVGYALSAVTIWLYPAGLQITQGSFVVQRQRSFELNAESALLFTTGSPNRQVVEGAALAEPRLYFDDTAPEKAQWKHRAHPAYIGSDFTIRVRWRSAPVTGSVKWEVAWAFGADGWAWEPSLTVVGAVVDSAASGAATPGTYDLNEATITVTTAGHKPNAGDTWFIQLRRVADDGSDNLAGDAEFVQMAVEYSVDSA